MKKENIDLKFDTDNCNFSVDIYKKVMLEVYGTYVTNTTFFLALSGAKGFGKTFFICLVAWFNICNFTDYNVQLARYTFTSAKTTYSAMMIRVATFLQKYGVTIMDKIESKEIKFYNSDNRCEFVFPNKRKVWVIGFDNTSKWEGVAAAIGEWGMFALDEVIPLKEKILDEEDYIYQLNNILIQIIRGQDLTTSFDNIEGLRYEDFQVFKKRMVIFGFNNHQTDHPIYQLYVQAVLPLTDERKKELKVNGYSTGIYKDFYGVGATVIRGTTKLNQANLNNDLLVFAEGLKKPNPEQYETLFNGNENEMQIDHYSYRKDLYANTQTFDLQEFYFDNEKRFWFDRITIGCDYADGGQISDDIALVMLGFELNKDESVKAIYILEEESINSRRFKKSNVDKVKYIAKTIDFWCKKYMHNLKEPFEKSIKFKIGQDSRTTRDFISKFLEEEYNYDPVVLSNGMRIFKSTGHYGWPIVDRHYVIKRLLSENKLFFSNKLTVTKEIRGETIIFKKYGHLYNELEKCINHPDKKIRNERPKANNLDVINAFEHALSFYRYRLFK